MTIDCVLNPHEVAQILGRHYETILDMVHDGRLAGTKRGGRVYIRESAVEAFLDPDTSDAA